MGCQAAWVLLFVLLFGGGGWGGGGYSYWNYMPFESLGDKDGGYISASYMNDWVDKVRASNLLEISRKMGPLMHNKLRSTFQRSARSNP